MKVYCKHRRDCTFDGGACEAKNPHDHRSCEPCPRFGRGLLCEEAKHVHPAKCPVCDGDEVYYERTVPGEPDGLIACQSGDCTWTKHPYEEMPVKGGKIVKPDKVVKGPATGEAKAASPPPNLTSEQFLKNWMKGLREVKTQNAEIYSLHKVIQENGPEVKHVMRRKFRREQHSQLEWLCWQVAALLDKVEDAGKMFVKVVEGNRVLTAELKRLQGDASAGDGMRRTEGGIIVPE